MSKSCSVKSVLVSLISSIDMYSFLLKNHHRRTAAIAYRLGVQYGLPPDKLCNLVLAASIHDIGALYVTERDQLLYVDAQNPQPHEMQGALMLEGFAPLEDIKKVIRHHHVKMSDIYTGSLKMDEIPIECFFLHLADRIDVLLTTGSKEFLTDFVTYEIEKRFGDVFLPELFTAFDILSHRQEFWESIEDLSLQELLYDSVVSQEIKLSESDKDGLAEVFARIVDFKSPWTANHSKLVGILAESIGKSCGFNDEKCHKLKLAGYLHDIGKIAIPTELLDKPSALDKNEYKVMKSHATYSSLILSKTPLPKDVKKWASSHHEKRDKSGYPLQLSNKDFSLEMDVIAYSDIFAALAEDRPYRAAVSKKKILSVLEEYSRDKLAGSVYRNIQQNIDSLYCINLQAQITPQSV